MRKIFLVLAGSFLTILLVAGQQAKPKFSFKSEIHDFGTISEEKGKVEFSFEFINVGGQPLVIHNVQASCGCTSPDWTKMPIPPGGKGFVKATFDPTGRPGAFNKTLTISSNSEEDAKILRITGVVEAKKLSIDELYPRNMDSLRLKAAQLSFTKVSPNAIKTETLDVINTSGKPMVVIFKTVPAHLKLKMEPEVLKPGQSGKIVGTYDGSKKGDWGFVVDQVYLVVGAKGDATLQSKPINYDNRLTVSATIEEDFSALTTEQLAKAPVVVFPENTFDFGNIKQGDIVKKAFVVTNTGKSELVIHKVKASCGCTAVNPVKSTLKPGESTEIMTEFNSTGKTGHQNKTITVITNDPKNTSVLLTITGNIVVN